ncbi:2-oxo acid dehydrogenase subunit E2 [Eubacteriaceae bacterium ES3]|nr:2-oxo acid dehydrogenase subunit E2 [Eubacteriaceae bacterium ES3]
MAQEIILPKLGMDMSSGTIIDWLVEEGDKVKKGEPILEIMTDKVSIEVEAEESGVILKILGEVDHEYPVYSVIGYIGQEGEWIPGNESTEAFVDHLAKIGLKSQNEEPAVKEAEPQMAVKPVRPQKVVPQDVVVPQKKGYDLSIDDKLPDLENYFQNDYYVEGDHVLHEVSVAEKKKLFEEIKTNKSLITEKKSENLQRARMSPAARRLMREAGIDLNNVLGTGPNGRIQLADVEKTISAIKAKGTAPVYETAEIETELESLVGHPENRKKTKSTLRPKNQSIKEMTRKNMTEEKNENRASRKSNLDFVPFVENGEANLRDEIIVKPTPIKDEEIKLNSSENRPEWEMPENLNAEPLKEEVVDQGGISEETDNTVEESDENQGVESEGVTPADKETERTLTTEAEKAEVQKAIEEAQAEKIKMMEAIKAAEAEKEEMIRLLNEERENREVQEQLENAKAEQELEDVSEKKNPNQLLADKKQKLKEEEDELEALIQEARKLARELLAEEESKSLLNYKENADPHSKVMETEESDAVQGSQEAKAEIPVVEKEAIAQDIIPELLIPELIDDIELIKNENLVEVAEINDLQSEEGETREVMVDHENTEIEKNLASESEPVIDGENLLKKTDVEQSQADESRKSIPLSGKRKIIAERMFKSHQENAVITLTVEIDMSEIKELRRKITGKVEEQAGYRCTYTDFLLIATSRALQKHEMMNCSRQNEQIFINEEVNIGLAVGQDDGLLVPVIKQCQTMNFVEMVKARGETLKKIKSKKYTPEDLKGSTFTITNLGMYGVESFTAIINQPNAAILSVGEVVSRMRVIHGEAMVRSVMKISLNLDHQVADGMAGAKFLEDVKADMENPSLLLF